MSYRSFKRVLGETSLERKCRFLFGACLLLLITGSFWWYGQQTEQLVFKQNAVRGELLVKTALNLIHYKSFDPNADFVEFVEALTTELQSDDYDWRFVDVQNADPQSLSRRDRAVLEGFQASPAPAKPQGFPSTDGAKYEYFQPVYATSQRCVQCHRVLPAHPNPNLSEGDLMAIGYVRISTAETKSDLAWNRAILISTAIITVFLAMVASYVIVRYVIVKPLKHLRDVSDAVSRGNIEQRAEIQTADEFEELGVAFNRMLRHLVAAQDELRQVSASLSGKVDELAQANMRLFEMNRLKSDFLATMSHELRTPLNSIIGFSGVLGSISSLDDKQRRYVQNIEKSGKMLLDMINDILDLAKIESGKMEIRAADFRLDQVVSTQCDMARPLTEKKNIDLAIDIEPRLPPLHQDQGKVQQVLNNLLSNAIKFTPEGGRITVAARAARDGVTLIVTDTGVGIAEEDQVHIFEKFRQGKTVQTGGDAMTREYSGTGLGLSIVKELCKLLGGEISLDSQLGKGSAFTVWLPIVAPSSARAEATLAAMADELGASTRQSVEQELGRAVTSARAG